MVGRAGAVTARAAVPYEPKSTTSIPTSTELAAAARRGDAVETAILAPRTTAAATASAVRRLSWPGNAAMTGTSRRMLNRPISAGSWSRALCTRRCSSSELAARARDSAPRPGRATTRASRQNHEPVVNTSPASAAVIRNASAAPCCSANMASKRASSTTITPRHRQRSRQRFRALSPEPGRGLLQRHPVRPSGKRRRPGLHGWRLGWPRGCRWSLCRCGPAEVRPPPTLQLGLALLLPADPRWISPSLKITASPLRTRAQSEQ